MRSKDFLLISILFFLIPFVSCGEEPKMNDTNEVIELIKIEYDESFDLIINPERGFYNHQAFYSSNNNVLSTAVVKSRRTSRHSLFLTLYYLQDFVDKPISEAFLSRIRTNMLALRDGGAKCVLRFAYSSSEEEKPWDASQTQVLQHIQQLKPILQEFSDVIYVMEAGFVGVWGEWYYTDNFVMNPTSASDYQPRRAVLDALLDALPQERMVCVRTPEFKLKCFDLSFNDTISLASAHDGSDLSRIAAHNDCFLATSNDMGTFSNNSQRAFWERESKYVVMGGETCGVSAFSTCENALVQMEKYHWTYLNSGYHGTVLSNWKSDNCYEEIERRMGYRLVLNEAKISKTPKANENFIAQFNIKNVGFAAPANPRKLELVFVSKTNNSQKNIVDIEEDPRFWFAGDDYSFSVEYKLPQEMKGKEYDVYLNLADPQPTLYDKPEFSIQLANKNVWNEKTGYNKVFSISVQ